MLRSTCQMPQSNCQKPQSAGQLPQSTSHQNSSESQAADVLIPLIRAAATIGFVVAPCSLGFVIIAVSEQLIRSIMVGEDPEELVSELQNRYPHAALEAADQDAGLIADVVALVAQSEQNSTSPFDINGAADLCARNVLQSSPSIP